MACEVKRKKGESFEAMMRRFTRTIQGSGILIEARNDRFYASEKSRNAQRSAALRRVQITERREYLLKSGKMKEDDFKKGRKRY